jgi:hypothetical protein
VQACYLQLSSFSLSLYLRTLSLFCCALIFFPHSGQYLVLLGLFDLNSMPHCMQVLMAIYTVRPFSLDTFVQCHDMLLPPTFFSDLLIKIAFSLDFPEKRIISAYFLMPAGL